MNSARSHSLNPNVLSDKEQILAEKDLDLKKLIERCRQDDRRAQEELYRRFYAYGITVCLHYTRDRTEAEQVLIDGFYKTFNRIRDFDMARDFKPWFRKILVHASIDHHRKSAKQQTTESLLVVDSAAAEISGLDKLQFDDLLNLLQQLPDQYRIVFNLFVMEGYSHLEIADKLGIGASTSKSNLTRAKAKLRIMLSEQQSSIKKELG